MALLGAAEPLPPRAGADPALPRQLQARRALNEAVCAELRARITALWDRLQVPAEDRDAFAVHMTGCRAKTRKAVRTPLCWGGGWGGSAGSHPPAGVEKLLPAAKWEEKWANPALVHGGAGAGCCLA